MVVESSVMIPPTQTSVKSLYNSSSPIYITNKTIVGTYEEVAYSSTLNGIFRKAIFCFCFIHVLVQVGLHGDDAQGRRLHKHRATTSSGAGWSDSSVYRHGEKEGKTKLSSCIDHT